MGFGEWGRDSAGAPAKPGGVFISKDADGHVHERAAFTCRHCGLPVMVPDGMKLDDVAYGCRVCGGLVCPRCGRQGSCKETGEFMKRVEIAERRERLRAAAGLTE